MKHAFKAVFWGFLGVRRGREYEADTKRVTPLQVVVAGLVGAGLFVAVLFGVVKLVTR